MYNIVCVCYYTLYLVLYPIYPIYTVESVSRLLPHEYEEIYLRVYVKHKSHKDTIEECFRIWCDDQSSSVASNSINNASSGSNGSSNVTIPTTPPKRRRMN